MNQKGVLLCSQCGAKARATCLCDAPYVPAGVLAAEYVKSHPDMSNVAIGKALGIGAETVRRAREPSSPNEEVIEKRIGLDGRVRRLPASRHTNPQPYELEHLPAAAQLLDGLEPVMHALKKEGAIRATIMSPSKIARLVREILSQIFASGIPQIVKAQAVTELAEAWTINPATQTQEEIDAVGQAVRALGDLHARMLAVGVGSQEQETVLEAAE